MCLGVDGYFLMFVSCLVVGGVFLVFVYLFCFSHLNINPFFLAHVDTVLECSQIFLGSLSSQLASLVDDAVEILQSQQPCFGFSSCCFCDTSRRPAIHSTQSPVNLHGIVGSIDQGKFLGISTSWVDLPQKLCGQLPWQFRERDLVAPIFSKFSCIPIYSRWLPVFNCHLWHHSEHKCHLKDHCQTLFNKV